MLEWAEQQYLLRYSAGGVPAYHHIYVFDCDPEREAIATRRGYIKTQVYNYYGRRDLSECIAPLELPSGYLIRSLVEEDIAQRAALNSLAGGGDVSEEKYRRMMMAALTYRQSLDLVATGPHGEVAAFCTVWLDEESRCGVVEPYGCASNHRRKGLGRDLLYEGMRQLKALGAKWVYVTHAGCEGDEIDAASELNRAVGFEQAGKNYMWRKELRGDELS
jgi:ribosomal protein S18 acetylase RimI-like enzyme